MIEERFDTGKIGKRSSIPLTCPPFGAYLMDYLNGRLLTLLYLCSSDVFFLE